MSTAALSAPKLLMVSKGPTYGANANPVAANAMRCYNTSVTAMTAEVLPITQDDGFSGGEINAPATAQYASALTTTTHLYGGGTAGSASPQDLLFRACGFNVTTVTGASVTYAPADLSSSLEWVDWNFNHSGQKRTAAGARGTFSTTLEAGQLGRCEWSLAGLYTRPTDQAMPVPVYSGAINPRPVNSTNTGTVTLGSFAACLNTFTYTQGNEYSVFNQSSCTPVVRIASSKPEASLTIMRPALSAFNPYQMIEESTVFALTVGHGVTAGNIITASLPKVSIITCEDADVGGLAAYNLTLSVQRDAGATNYVSLAFT